MGSAMLNPLSLPGEVVAALRSVAAIERLLDERLRGMEVRLASFELQMQRLPAEIEQTLRRHFEGQRGDLAGLHDELVANREQAEQLPGKVDGLRDEMRGLLVEISDVRETVEPLQGPAERLARLDERLPGGA
jgi:chromosome segregation ATPase